MPSQQQIQDTILAGGQRISAIMLAATINEAAGFKVKDLGIAQSLFLNVNALTRQYNLEDYDSAGALSVYDCINQLAGQPSGGDIDPNYQSQTTQIVTNPNVLGPAILGYDDFDPASTDPSDDGRTLCIKAAWKGFIPIMSAGAPALTLLQNNIDFAVLATGGFMLLPGSTVMPKIYPNQNILVTGFENVV